jgi:mono/diheme cytochrome c family protein
LRRNLLTFGLILALLAAGGLAVSNNLDPLRLLFKGTYVPDASGELFKIGTTGVSAALVLVLGIPLVLGAVISMGVALAIAFNRATQMEAAFKAKESPAPKPAAAPRAAPAAKGTDKADAPGVPLTSNRSLAIFWIVTSVIVIGFMALKYGGLRGVYVPGVTPPVEQSEPEKTGVLFTLPGERPEGMPEELPGPGTPLTIPIVIVGVLGGLLVTTAVAGFGLARGLSVLDHQIKTADKLPRTQADTLIAQADQQVQALLKFRPETRPGAGLWDQLLIGLNLLLVLVIGGLITLWILPSFTGVAAVDQAVEATRIAGLATPTPKGKTALEFLQEDYAALPAGDAAAGETTFTSAGCAACHSLQPDQRIVGPSQAGIAARGASQREGYPSELYIYESIINPSAFIVPEYQDNVMPKTFKDTLSPEDLANLIAFLMTK